MNPTDTIRYLAHEAKICRDRDAAEALCLLFPALLRLLRLEAMNDVDAVTFHMELKHQLAESKQEYKVDGTCVECHQLTPLPITSFAEGQCRAWCDVCAGERVFLLKSVRAEVPA